MKLLTKKQFTKKITGINLILLVLSITLFSACQKNEPQRYFSSSPEIDVAKALLKDYHDGNWEGWITHYADTAKIYHNTWDKGLSPKETIANLKDILSYSSSYHFDEGDDTLFYEMIISDEGNKWVYFWGNWRGTLAANNKELEIPVHLAFRFADGKIAREEGFYDLSGFTAALGEIEAAKMKDAESEDE